MERKFTVFSSNNADYGSYSIILKASVINYDGEFSKEVKIVIELTYDNPFELTN